MKKLKFVLSIVWPIALIVIGLYLFLLFRGGMAFGFGKIEFNETTGECVSVGYDVISPANDRSREGRPNDKEQYYIIYNYMYQVDGNTYTAMDRNHREIDDYQSYQKEMEQSQNWIGRTTTIYYNPEKPEVYSFTNKSFEESVSETNWVVGIIAVLCSVILLPWIILTRILKNALRERRR